MRVLAAEAKGLQAELAEIEEQRQRLGAALPNLPDPEAPDGDTEDDAVVLREVGERPSFDFEPRDHLELGIEHGWIEIEKAAEASGSRFAYLLGDLVMVELALIRFAVDVVRGEGFEPVVPPVLVRDEAPLHGTGFFPGEREQIYEIERDELFLAGTSEVPLAALGSGEILAADDLPRRYAGISTCFRREAGAAGKDTRGIFRVHQFDKVEMFSFVEPGESKAEHERILAIEERILAALEIPYRVVDIPVGDLGRLGGAQVRLRGVDPEPGSLPRADLVLEHHRLPGSAPRLPLSPRARGAAAGGPHAQRHGDRRGPHAGRPARERPASRRQRRPAGGARRSGRAGRHRRLAAIPRPCPARASRS